MTEGIILLSQNNCYVDKNGNLPKRPHFDKEFLLGVVKNKKVLCSKNTLATLPKSVLQAAAYITTDPKDSWEVNLGIETFQVPPDTLYVVRSNELITKGGLEFRFDSSYEKILHLANFEIYRRHS